MNKMTGLVGTILGIIIAIVGAYFWIGGHSLRGPVLLVVGVLVLAFGVYAYMNASKKAMGA